MQEIHSIDGGGGRFHGGGCDSRRLRLNQQYQNHQAAVKCPRCDSLNTKFCYYNNYNLSQPRHYCKGCRRYWTNGGVLRNVPVGGGCRKRKQSKPKPSNVSTTVNISKELKSNSNSSSESSSLTTTTTTTTPAAAKTSVAVTPEVVSANSSNSNLLTQLPESSFSQQVEVGDTTEGKIFHNIGNITNLMTASCNDPFDHVNNILMYPNSNEQWSEQHKVAGTDELKMEYLGVGLFDQTAQVEYWQTGGGRGGGDQLFDMTTGCNNDDHQSYWSQTQWGENDYSLNYLP